MSYPRGISHNLSAQSAELAELAPSIFESGSLDALWERTGRSTPRRGLLLRLHRGPHDIGPRGGCRTCQRRARRPRELAGGVLAGIRPHGATLLAWVVVALYFGYEATPDALRGREGVDVLVSAAAAAMLLTLPVALLRAVLRAARQWRWNRRYQNLTRGAAAAAKAVREREDGRERMMAPC